MQAAQAAADSELLANKNGSAATTRLLSFKNITLSLTLITSALSRLPKTAKWYIVRSQIYRVLGRNQLAFFDINSALRLEPRSSRLYAMCVLLLLLIDAGTRAGERTRAPLLRASLSQTPPCA